MSDTANPSGRSIPLDILRGLAILLVLGRHDIYPARPQSGLVAAPIYALWQIGWTGVDLFFVLSGFLVGGLIFAEIRRHGDFHAQRFVQRRWFRTLPLYAVYIASIYAARKIQMGVWPPFRYLRSNAVAMLPYFTFTQNYLGQHADQTWSLAVEEHFYIGLPLLILLLLVLHRRAPNAALRAIPWVSLALVLGCTAARLISNGNRPYNSFSHHVPTHLRIDGLFFGVFLAYLYHFHRKQLERFAARRWLLVAVGIGLVAPFAVFDVYHNPYVWTIGFTQLYLGYGCLVLAAVFVPADRRFGPISRLVALIGFYSYGIYIWHSDTARPVLIWLCGDGGFLLGLSPTIRWAVVYALFTGSSFLLAWLSYRWIERPALALRDRWCPGRTRSAIGAAAADAVGPRQLVKPEVEVVRAAAVRGY